MIEPSVDSFVISAAQRVRSLGLREPALALLEMHKPLRGVMHAMSLVLQPAMAVLIGTRNSGLVVNLFESSEHIERLIEVLESEGEEGL